MAFNTHRIQEGQITVIDTPERLTYEVADELKQIIKDVLENECYKIVINLEHTVFMDSSGLGAIVSKIAKTRSHNGDIILAAPQKYVSELLELTHINQVLKDFPTVEEALDRLKE